MVKKCKVLLKNEYVMVVEFEGKEIQFPSDHTRLNTVFVKYENDRYSIVDKIDENKTKTKRKSKVTEVELANDVTKEKLK